MLDGGYPAILNNASSSSCANRLRIQANNVNGHKENGDVINNSHNNLGASVGTNKKDGLEIKTHTSKINSSVVFVEPDRQTNRSNSSHTEDRKDSLTKIIEMETLSHLNNVNHINKFSNINNIFHKSLNSRLYFTIAMKLSPGHVMSGDCTSENDDNNNNVLQFPSPIMPIAMSNTPVSMNNINKMDHISDLDLNGLNKFSHKDQYICCESSIARQHSSVLIDKNEMKINDNENKNNKFNDPTDTNNETEMARTKTNLAPKYEVGKINNI